MVAYDLVNIIPVQMAFAFMLQSMLLLFLFKIIARSVSYNVEVLSVRW